MHLVVRLALALFTAATLGCSAAPAPEPARPTPSVAKDADALSVEVEVAGASADDERGKQLLLAHVERSRVLSAGDVPGPRKLKLRLTVEEPTADSRGLTRKLRLEGKNAQGSCTILTLSREITKPGGKLERAADREETLAAGIDALLQKLEEAAPKIGDDATCFATGK